MLYYWLLNLKNSTNLNFTTTFEAIWLKCSVSHNLELLKRGLLQKFQQWLHDR